MLYLGGDDYRPLQHTSYQNLTMEEAAQVLGVSRPTFYRRLQKAHSLLRAELEGREQYEG